MRKEGQARGGIGRNVVAMGLTSFFTDISSEMVYPLIQAFVSLLLSSTKTMVGPLLGLVEGVAEATASLLKVYSGYMSDRLQRRKALTISGYSLSAASKLLYLAAHLSWAFVLLARFSDRVGKGIRTAPRDALISESADSSVQGKAYGFHRAMDYLGALLGVAICYFISIRYLDPLRGTITDISSFYTLFLISIVPAVAGVLMLFFVREGGRKASAAPGAARPATFSLRGMDGSLRKFFIAVLVFTLGNSSNQFLLLKTMEAGTGLPRMLLMYMVFNLTTSILSTPLGSLSDRIGRKRIILAGYLLYAIIYLMFGFITSSMKDLLWVFWALYGVYYALTEGVEKALVADLAPKEKKGTVMGFFNTITGVGLLPASLIAGFLYSYSPVYPFVFGGATALAAFVIILFFLKEQRVNG